MKVKQQLPLMLLVITLVGLFSGCAKYQALPLDRFSRGTTKERSIFLSYHVFNRNDCRRYLDRDVIEVGYNPIQVIFTNNTSRYFKLSLSNFNLPVTRPEDIADQFHKSVAGRATGYGAVGVFLCWPFVIPAIVDGVKASKANKQLTADYSRKSLQDQIVKPYSTVQGLIFVPVRSFDGEFSLSVTDSNTSEIFVLSSSNPELKIG